jgi:2-keto-4-pentenoate hydratase
MSESASHRSALADELLQAYDSAGRLPLLTGRPGGVTSLAEAYAIADQTRRRRLARGERLLGYKIGFTNRSIWQRYGVHAPIWGPVWDRTVAQIEGTRHTVSLAGLVQPRLEPEIMFGFARAPAAGMDVPDLVGCIDWVAHGFEIVHTHFDDWRFAAPDTVADFALHGRLMVGPGCRSRDSPIRAASWQRCTSCCCAKAGSWTKATAASFSTGRSMRCGPGSMRCMRKCRAGRSNPVTSSRRNVDRRLAPRTRPTLADGAEREPTARPRAADRGLRPHRHVARIKGSALTRRVCS